MLTILIVDDEMPAILAIKQRVDWKRLKSNVCSLQTAW